MKKIDMEKVRFEMNKILTKEKEYDILTKIDNYERSVLDEMEDMGFDIDDSMYDDNISLKVPGYLLTEFGEYLDMGFSHCQLHTIREGLLEGLDVSSYADIKFNYFQMQEILYGLRSGIDVSVYAKECFNNIQMRQIRLGLEESLPVNFYCDPSFNAAQMKQIRMGLIESVDVNLYNDPMLSVERMFLVRKMMEDNKDALLKGTIPVCEISNFRDKLISMSDDGIYRMLNNYAYVNNCDLKLENVLS